MDEGSSSSSRPPSSSIHLGSSSRSIDRHNPIIRDPTRRIAAKPLHPPSSSHPPPPPPPLPTITPKRYNLLHLLHHKGRKCSSSNPNNQTNKSSARSSSSTRQKKKSSSADLMSRSDSSSSSSSSRYLLGDMAFVDILSDFDPFLELVPVDHSTYSQSVKPIESSASKPPSSSRSPPQVVVLRVSLHCKGCEGKVRKHISRMQGVTSFNIDFAAKKVTVVGDVTPLGVLASLSKVKKNAQLWTPAMSSSEIKETKRVGE